MQETVLTGVSILVPTSWSIRMSSLDGAPGY